MPIAERKVPGADRHFCCFLFGGQFRKRELIINRTRPLELELIHTMFVTSSGNDDTEIIFIGEKKRLVSLCCPHRM